MKPIEELIEELEDDLRSARADFVELKKVHAHTCQQLADARLDIEDLRDELRDAPRATMDQVYGPPEGDAP